MNYRNVSNFAKGLITAGFGRGKADLTSLLEAENVRVHTGTAEPRDGQIYLHDALVDDVDGDPVVGDINSLYEYTRGYYWLEEPEFHREYIFQINRDLYAWISGGAIGYLINQGYQLGSANNTNPDVWVAVYMDWAFIGDGVNVLRKYDAIAYLDVGIAPPLAAPVVTVNPAFPARADAGTGVDNFRAYKYRYTYMGTGSVIDAASVFSDVTNSGNFVGKQPTIDLVASLEPGVDHIELYCTEAVNTLPELAGLPFYFLVATLSIPGASFSDNVIDANLGAAEDTDIDWTVPPAGLTKLLYYKDRLYGVAVPDAPSILMYSDLGNPQRWPQRTNWLDVRMDDGDVITCLAVRGNSLFIFKNRSIYVLTGDPAAVPIMEVKSGGESVGVMTEFGLGCTAPRSLASFGDSTLIFYSSAYGVYMITGGEFVHLSKNVSGITGLGDDTSGAIWQDTNGEVFYVLSPSSGDTWVCHLASRTWVNDTNINVPCFLVDNNGYLLGGADGRINRYYDPTYDTDNGTTIICKIKTAWLNLRDGIMHAVVRSIGIQSEDLMDSCTLSLYNQDDGEYTTTFDGTVRRVGINGLAGRLFSLRLEWIKGKVESLTYHFIRRRGH